ncbi:MAG: hypothetical protein KIT22_03270 [Verrucomicrobiae bacterium]|nr:hypothetical protein [Verrucomicrobiae bacterium]
MTSTKVVSVKIPARLLRRMPAAGEGRSRFILDALEEKISRNAHSPWKPTTERGRRLASLLEKGRQERTPLLDADGIAQELANRRGQWH